MVSKRKSVTFHENVSTIYPTGFDGSSSPAPFTTTPAATVQPLTLDPMYLTWLRSATRAHYPFILNGTFAMQVYRQNFDEHVKVKTIQQLERARDREAAVPALAERYGSLGWGNLYKEVSAGAWVKNYREIYRFAGSDEHLLEMMEEAYHEIKHAVAEEERAHADFTQAGSIYSPLSTRRWESFTQGAGALVRPDLGPEGAIVTFDHTVDGPFEEEGLVMRHGAGDRNGRTFDMGVVNGGFGGEMAGAETSGGLINGGGMMNGGKMNGGRMVDGGETVNGGGVMNGGGIVNNGDMVNGGRMMNGGWMMNGGGTMHDGKMMNGRL